MLDYASDKFGGYPMKLITTDPRELAQRRVLRGIYWLDENAPFDWRRRLIDVHNGYFSARFDFNWPNEDVLSLAFEHEGALADGHGEVTRYTVAKHFGWLFQNKVLIGLGFLHHPDISDDAERLKKVWWHMITHEHSSNHVPHRHHHYPNISFDEPRTKRWWNRIWPFQPLKHAA